MSCVSGLVTKVQRPDSNSSGNSTWVGRRHLGSDSGELMLKGEPNYVDIGVYSRHKRV